MSQVVDPDNASVTIYRVTVTSSSWVGNIYLQDTPTNISNLSQYILI